MMDIRLDVHPNGDEPEVWEFVVDDDIARSLLVVSSVRIQTMNAEHTRLKFWNRGASTGEWVVVKSADALLIVARLFGVSLTEFANVIGASIRKTFDER